MVGEEAAVDECPATCASGLVSLFCFGMMRMVSPGGGVFLSSNPVVVVPAGPSGGNRWTTMIAVPVTRISVVPCTGESAIHCRRDVMLPAIENGAHTDWAAAAAAEDWVVVAPAMAVVVTSPARVAHAAACTTGTASPACLLVLPQGTQRRREKQVAPMVLVDVAKEVIVVVVVEDAEIAGCSRSLCPLETSIR